MYKISHLAASEHLSNLCQPLFYPLLAQSQCLHLLEMLKPLGNNLAMIAGAHFIMANTHQQNIASLEVSRNKINTKDLAQMKALDNPIK